MSLLAQAVFVSRILGLISGDYPVDVVADAAVARVEILLNGTVAETLDGKPWRAIVDFGPDIEPQELTAIAYDAAGNEVARDTQIVNLARPPAELGLNLDRDPASGRLRATSHWQHVGEAKPKRIEIKLDGKRIATTGSVLLPPLAGTAMHVLEAEVRFPDGVVARKEMVFGGQYAEQFPTELTAVVVHRTGSGHTDLSRCFRVGDEVIPAAGIERSAALVVFVRDPDLGLAARILQNRRPSGLSGLLQGKTMYGLAETKMQVMWPVARKIGSHNAVANLFERSNEIDGQFGTHWLLTAFNGPRGEEYRFTDAVSVAGVLALSGARRRAVVLVAGDRYDGSRHDPRSVRRYLERVGVPLRVWSLVGAQPELVEEWGPVADISTPALLQEATKELRAELASQWIVWMSLPPLDALRVTATPDCAFTPVAAAEPRTPPSERALP
jgi:hypothetical protein